ncbi:hypothetical protein [Sanguibacter suaedae]|uniref:Uncharacterized protein n=1 Tax=Sanguibacter suaedae TaxID=2795737 RepID=A0A934MCC7_9MICO|nr:hypothetical protein [Sanguibacter suaedae]MBI9113744.1 hypothetical protein [Sanguibacter suaedae]
MTGHRVAYVCVADGGLALGNPAGTHVLLDVDGVHERPAGAGRPASPRDGQREGWSVPWSEVVRLDVEATRTRLRHPGFCAGAITAALATVGLEWEPRTCPVTVRVGTSRGERSADCSGYEGRGYFVDRATALEQLFGLLVSHPAQRDSLADPLAVLTRVVTASSLRDPDAIRTALTASS